MLGVCDPARSRPKPARCGFGHIDLSFETGCVHPQGRDQQYRLERQATGLTYNKDIEACRCHGLLLVPVYFGQGTAFATLWGGWNLSFFFHIAYGESVDNAATRHHFAIHKGKETISACVVEVWLRLRL